MTLFLVHANIGGVRIEYSFDSRIKMENYLKIASEHPRFSWTLDEQEISEEFLLR